MNSDQGRNSRYRILRPGHNCWRISRAEKLSFLIDGEAYFNALYSALPLAKQEIMILAWDIYSEIRLGALKGDGRTLVELFNDLLDQTPALRTYILNWDFSLLFSMSREWLPHYQLGMKSHSRLTFKLDSEHPVGASQHQKAVIIDGRLAFNGGLDLTHGRWDNSEHKPGNPDREKVDGTRGRPYHDVQLALNGEAAGTLNQLAHERWLRATGNTLPESLSQGPAPWPDGLDVDLHDIDVAISRTEPGFRDYREVREVEQLNLDAIAAAEHYIYIENQYFTSPQICDALALRLQEPEGPDIVINLPLKTEGWLAQNSMDIIRINLIQQLRRCQYQHRLRVYFPFKADAIDTPINLHAKLMIIDDCFVRVGSSNLNNRSMGLDSECDIALECLPEDSVNRRGVRHFRNRLLAEHLGSSTGVIDDSINRQQGLIPGIEAQLEKNPLRTLKSLEDELPDYQDSLLTEPTLMDPEQPVNMEEIFDHAIIRQQPASTGRRIYLWLFSLLVVVGLGLAWRFTPLSEWLDMENITSVINTLNESYLAPVLLIICFALASIMMVPVTLLIIAFVMVFDVFLGAGYALAGAMLSAAGAYLIGSLLGRESITSLAGGKIKQLHRHLQQRGIFAIVVLRIVPVAPFTVINLAAGALKIRRKDFLAGTALGMTPGIAGVAILTDRVQATVQDPSPLTIAILIAVAILILGSGFALSQYVMKQREKH